MIIFPAVDIQKGKAVRLKQGQASEVTVFDCDPIAAARHWEGEGARYLHVVDLDGAFAGDARSFDLIEKICAGITIPVQLGGGIRDEQTARRYLDCGVTRLIIGTMALEDPETFSRLTTHFPGKIGVSLDVDHGMVKTHGWLKDTGLTLEQVLPDLAARGASFLISTDISRDGMQTGANIDLLTELARISPIPLLAAGGVASLKDVMALYPLSRTGKLEGIITGRALYEGTLNLREANAWIETQRQQENI